MAKSISRRLADSASPTGAIDGTLSTAAQTNITSLGTLSALTVSGDLTVDTSTLKVDSTNNRVGIGTTSPNSLAHVYGGSSGRSWTPDGADKLALEHNDSVTFDIRTPNNKQGLILFSDADARARGIVGYVHASDHMYFNTAGTERMRIDSSGNVGIGRASVAQPSAGATTLAIQGTSTTKGGAIQLYSSDDSVAAYIYPDSSSGLSINTSTSHPIVFRTAATERMRIDSSGRVGIKTTPNAWNTAWSVLDIGVSGSLFAQDNNTTGLSNNLYYNGSNWVHKNTGQTALYQQSEGLHLFYSNASQAAGATFSPTERMRIDTSGNVGIGQAPSTFSNWKILEIKGGTAGAMLNFENSASTRVSTLAYDDSSNSLRIQNFLANPITFETNNAESMRLTSGGKLVVNGTVAGYSGTYITVGSPSITTSGLSILNSTTGHGYLMFGDATGDAAAGYVGQIHYNHSSNSMDIVTNGVKACEWDSGGLLISNQTVSEGRRRGMYGLYSPTHIAHIWGMGTTYKVAANGSDAGNLYGLCYSYEPNYGSTGTNPGARSGLGHQMQWRANGGTHTAIGNGIYTVGSVTANSDARLKTDIETIPNAMSKVSALTGITYKRIDLSEPDAATGLQQDVRHTGVLAQDLLAVLPEAVEGAIDGQQPEDGTYLSVAYGNMAGLFIEALKEQQATIEALTQRLTALENN